MRPFAPRLFGARLGVGGLLAFVLDQTDPKLQWATWRAQEAERHRAMALETMRSLGAEGRATLAAAGHVAPVFDEAATS